VKPLRILFICPYVPSLIRVRPYNIIKAMAQHNHQITLLALVPPGEDTDSLDTLRAWCQRVHTVRLPRWRTIWNGLRALPSQVPFQAAYSRSPEMSGLIQRTLATEDYDVVHVEHLRGAELSRAVNKTPIVYDSVDSITLLFERVSHSGPTWRSRLIANFDLSRTRHYEGHLLDRFPRVLVTSPKDREALARLSASPNTDERLIVLPNGVDLDYFSPVATPREPATLIFSGKMSYHANVAAALDLAGQIMPHVWKRQSNARLIIAGKDPTPELLSLTSDPRIIVTGTVPDLRPYLAKATVSVSPMRYGVGIQNKLLEAMAMATPVVSTPQATTALQVQPGQDLLVADTPRGMAESVIALLEDEGLRRYIGQAGRSYVETYHNWNRAAERLEEIYREVVAEARYLYEVQTKLKPISNHKRSQSKIEI
jgi:sugar transferase (PEP-CTERM/EpsH1 system associated)